MCVFSSLSTATELDAGFSPGGSAEALVVRAILSAKKQIQVAAYSFTSKEIASSLVNAHRRGVEIFVVLDSSQISQQNSRYSSATYLANAGIPVRIDHVHAIMHNKYLVIDGATVSTGSYNFTTSAEKRNAENVVVVWNNPIFAQLYSSDWLIHWEHSSAYAARY
jgi:phosphatidylserine/phosphatidylglycerophosphate/cardiolipin synthase-like enzyme